MLAAVPFLTLAVAANPLVVRQQSASPIAGFTVPPSRGWNYATAADGPCGGIEFKDNHTYWGMKADFLLNIENDVSDIRLSWSENGDMSGAKEFNRISKATAGQICLENPVDFSALGLSRGDEITVQIAFHDDVTNRDMYNCVDLALTSDHADADWNIQCTNTSHIGDDSNAGSSGSSTSSGSKQKVSPLAAGFIGACVTLAVVGLVLAGLKLGGCLFFNKTAYNRAHRRSTSRQFDDGASDGYSLNERPSIQKQPIN